MESHGEDPSDAPTLLACLRAAVAAPSIHNTQPWLLGTRDGVIDVFADHSRRLNVLDPHGRELMISIGAAVLNLRVAMLACGRSPRVRLLPEPSRPELAARITMGPRVTPPEPVQRLARAIPDRHTNRRPCWVVPTPPDAVEDLVAAARIEGAGLAVAPPGQRQEVLGLVRTAEERWSDDPAYRAELSNWTSAEPHRRDGVPAHAYGPRDSLHVVPVRDFGLVRNLYDRWTEPFEDQPTIAVLHTEGDTPRDWLHAGLALERALLTATVRGLAATVMSQPVEVPALRARLTGPAEGRVAQLVIRFGYARPGRPSPRRPVEEVLTSESTMPYQLRPAVRDQAPLVMRGREISSIDYSVSRS